MEELKESVLKFACTLGVVLVVIGLVLVIFTGESDADQAERRSKECARQGYNGIAERYTKEGDLYFVCENYPSK